jgi:uncharacterized cupin superfamily protein
MMVNSEGSAWRSSMPNIRSGLTLMCTAGTLLLATVGHAQTATARIIRFEPNGPAGQGLHANAGSTVKTHTYYKSPADERITAGVWTSPDYTAPMHVQEFTEFIYLVEGSVTLQAKDGREETFKKGDAVLIPRGSEFSWKKTNSAKHYYVNFDFEGPGSPAPQGTPTFFKLDPEGPGGKGLKGREGSKTKTAGFFTGGDKSSVGVWETIPDNRPQPNPVMTHCELMVFLSGNPTMVTPTGEREVFKAGEVVLAPNGSQYKWESDTTRKIFVTFDRLPTPAAPGSTAAAR